MTLFPEFVATTTNFGVCGRALRRGLIGIESIDPREFANDVHRTVDDRPYGGGPGMVLKYEPVAAAISSAREKLPEGSKVIFLSPQGRTLNQEIAGELSELPGLVLVAGRYEGFDERLLEDFADEELSIGDYVLSGGEAAVLVVIDTVVRLLPGVLGDELSAEQDSFMDGLLDCPHYTRPEVVDDRQVPSVLLNGNHAAIKRWRLKESLGRTWLRRPDLLEERKLTADEEVLLQEFIAERDA